MFRIYDSDHSKNLDFEEVKMGLSRYGIDLSQDECNSVFTSFDTNGNGKVDLGELMKAIKPPMSKSRMALVDAAFKKMDKSGDGLITQEDIHKVFNIEHHPKFKAGQWTAEQCFNEFLDSFQVDAEKRDQKVSLQEFQDYYAGVSAGIDRDVYFDYMMRNAWKM